MARLFQSTQPSQAVTIDRVDALKDSYEFQSTQPSQAVTKEIETLSAYIKISIHTALAGCDQLPVFIHLSFIPFQSTQPSQAVTAIIPNKNHILTDIIIYNAYIFN